MKNMLDNDTLVMFEVYLTKYSTLSIFSHQKKIPISQLICISYVQVKNVTPTL